MEINHEVLTELNSYLVTIFNEVVTLEEDSLKQSDFADLSIKEMHTIEAIGLSGELSSTQVAKKLRVTVGTLSVSIQNLVRKNYVERVRLENDRRVVRLKLTKRGKLLYRLHRKFHMNMVERTLEGFDPEEAEVLIKGLKNLHAFLSDIKDEMN